MNCHDNVFNDFLKVLTKGKEMEYVADDEHGEQLGENQAETLNVFNYSYYGSIEISNHIVEFKGIVEIINGELESIGDIDFMSIADRNVQTVEKWFHPTFKQHSICEVFLFNIEAVRTDIINSGWIARKDQLETI